MKKVLEFLKSKFLWFNVLAAVVLVFVLFVALSFWMDSYTRHGQAIQVPKITGLNQAEAELVLRELDLNYEVIDSVYNRMLRPGEIAEQTPAPQSFVKKHRKIYITVNAKNKRQVMFTDYRGFSFRKAQSNYRNLGFNADSVRFIPSEYSGELLDVEYMGKKLNKGDKLPEASVLVLVVGRVDETMQVLMPSFYGSSYRDAMDMMKIHNLVEGVFSFDEDIINETDVELFFVYGQEPKEGIMVPAGKGIDLYFSKNKKKEYISNESGDEDEFF